MKLQTVFSGAHFSDAAKEAKFQPPWIVQIIMFLIVFSLSATPQSIAVMAAVIVEIIKDRSISGAEQVSAAITEKMMNPSGWVMVVQLLATVFTAALVIIYCRFLERRGLRSMGFVKKGFAVKYLIGLAAGFAMFSATLLISYAAGAVKYVGTDVSNGLMLGLMCVGWLIQGAEEEILCRGYFMPSLSTKMPLWAAALISSVFFSLMHLMNAGFNLIVLINLTLTGLMFAALAVRFDSLFVCCAAHSIWNLAQGNFYGLPVSGMDAGPSVFRFELAEGAELWTGGTFGLEGSLSETIVMVVVIAALVFIPKRKGKAADLA
ncbi:MAG: CPBP family intramembrane metalloprotease [Lachnospiraceae bacterium]|nr:CPBP family intramembrane metalloprotease [Ruminococcus sp.]MCM1274500.1 CPBP family intramembrane metalloprotease [Lachnospiraceae bacterium]